MFKKKDLKDGDIVTYRNGWKRTFIGGKLINEEGVISKTIDEYNENLENLSFGGPSKENELNIVKVERPVKYETIYEDKEILEKEKKRYLKGVIRPFRDKVKFIEKVTKSYNDNRESFINIDIDNDENIMLPYFDTYTMYKGMELGEKYTLKELGL